MITAKAIEKPLDGLAKARELVDIEFEATRSEMWEFLPDTFEGECLFHEALGLQRAIDVLDRQIRLLEKKSPEGPQISQEVYHTEERKTMRAETLINILNMFDIDQEVFVYYSAGGKTKARLSAYIDKERVQLVIGTDTIREDEE